MKIRTAIWFPTALFLFVFQSLSYAQSFRYPKLTEQGRQTGSLVPKRWKIIDSLSGDLNSDQRKDLVMIMEYDQEVRENRAYGDANTEIITEVQRPRILVIYFKTASGSYRLAHQNNNFILRSAEGGKMGDPLRPLRIDANQLILSFEGGGTWKWNLSYAFKYRSGNWILENAANRFYHPESGELNEQRYDFVRRKKVSTRGSLFNRASAKESSTSDLQIRTPRTFGNFKKPWTWEIGPDELL